MRCAVTNSVEETPAVNRRVSVWYQYVARDNNTPEANENAWNSADMVYKGKDAHGLDWYEGTIPTQKVGYVWYYYRVDYDGYHYGNNPLTGRTESISPAFWDAGKDTHVRPTAGTKFQVRPYQSRYGRVAIEATPADASIPAMTLVDNEQWQAVVPVSGITVVSNYFVGYGYYEDDAEAYESTPVKWGENNPDALSDPTLAGYLESTQDTIVTNQLVALNQKDYRGFYLYRFSSNYKDVAEGASGTDEDRRYDYIVKKAVYQDFDDWTASPQYYETSLGGLPTLTFAENFNGNADSNGVICVHEPWGEDEYFPEDYKSEKFEDEEEMVSDQFSSDTIRTEYDFFRTGSRIVENRVINSTVTERNKYSLGLKLDGKIENTRDSLPYGLEKITFKARASIDDSNFSLYTKGTAWAIPANGNSIYVSASCSLDQRAISKPYLSFIFLYQLAGFDEGASWYEVRIIQIDNDNSNKEKIRLELWRRDSNATASVFVAGSSPTTSYNLATPRTINVRGWNSSNKFAVDVYFGTTKLATITDPTANATRLSKGGTVGFGVFDAVPIIQTIKVGTTNGGSDLVSSLSSTYGDWSHGGTRPDNQNRWSVSSTTITREVPTQTIKIFAADCIGGELQADPSELYEAATCTVNTLNLTDDLTVNFKAWNKKFVQIRYADGDGGLVLDDIVYSPWRAITRYNEDRAFTGSEDSHDRVDYLDWTSEDQQKEWLDRSLGSSGDHMRQHWAILEGWTVENSGGFGIGANFERSRANPNLMQGVVSPELENGLGSCSFYFRVTGGKVVYGVERSEKGSADYSEWIPVAVYTNAANESGERYTKVGMNYGENNGGRLRVRIYGEQDVAALLDKNENCGYDPLWGFTDDNAKILIDNLRVKDYPEDKDDNAWNAYNLLITNDKNLADAGLIFNNSGKSCFFNNHQTNGVYGAERFIDDDPYLESPPLSGVGVGEIAFQYRLVPGTAAAGTDGHIVIKVAPRRDTPLAEWVTITNLVVSADGSAFVKFDNDKIFDENNYVVRFYNSTNSAAPRVVIDNVLVTAPARPSFEFEYVHLLPEQPLGGTNTVVEAKIMREVMNPQHVRIYVSYHKYDTNDVNDVWGVANWFNPLTSPKKELDPVGEKIYRTPEGDGIPAFEVNDIVEFVVWGVHDAINLVAGDTPIKQTEDTFENPEWYRTVVIEDKEIVTMDMNVDKAEEGWSPYYWVFSCPPGTFFVNEFNNWRTDSTSADVGSAEYIEFAGLAGTDLGGWKLRIVHNENTAGYSDMDYTIPTGFRLRDDTQTGWGFFLWGDSCSSEEFRINSSPPRMNVPFNVNAAFPNSGTPSVRHLGNYAGVMIFRPNGMVEECVRFGTKTVAAFNGESEIWDYAGRKKSSNPASLSRISPFDGSGGLVPGATAADFIWWNSDLAEEDEYAEVAMSQTPGAPNTVQVFADLGGGGVVALYDPDGNEITDEDVLAWIETYGAEQSDIDELTMDEFNTDFLLNLDLTKDCVAELKITSIRIEDGYVYLGVQLTRTEDNVAVGTRKINGVLKLLGRADLTTGTFTALQPDDFDDTFETGNSVDIEYELPVSNPPKFFKAVIEAPTAQ